MSAMKNPRATVFCPSEPTITIECDNDQGVKFSVCLVRPIANSTASGCEIDLECVKRADDPVETEFLCEHRDVAAVASLPSSLTYFSLSGNPLKCFKPSFPQGPSQLKSVALTNNSIERMEEVHVPATTRLLYLSDNPIKEIKFHRGIPNVAYIYLLRTQIRSIENVSLPPSVRSLDLDATNIEKLVFHAGLNRLETLSALKSPTTTFEVSSHEIALRSVYLSAPTLGHVKLPNSVEHAYGCCVFLC
ncbi:hypothetical protein PINS_up004197 [Pythium insidiosum]|nr:hypothetical protein PINS_up004197 [Pythium insidiosum]